MFVIPVTWLDMSHLIWGELGNCDAPIVDHGSQAGEVRVTVESGRGSGRHRCPLRGQYP